MFYRDSTDGRLGNDNEILRLQNKNKRLQS